MEHVITLFRGEKCYYATNQDAEVVASICRNVNSFSIKDTKYSVFSSNDLDRNLPILVRHGNRVNICDVDCDA